MTPLTPENAQVGMWVVCVDADFSRGRLKNGERYRITRKRSESLVVLDDFSPFDYFVMTRFVLAEPEPARPALRALLAEHDPELLEVLLAERDRILSWQPAARTSRDVRFLNTIERANLHAPAEVQAPGVTDARATLDLEWWA